MVHDEGIVGAVLGQTCPSCVKWWKGHLLVWRGRRAERASPAHRVSNSQCCRVHLHQHATIAVVRSSLLNAWPFALVIHELFASSTSADVALPP